MHAIIRELQKRYLGSFPLVEEKLWLDSLITCKEESYMLVSVVLDMKPPSLLNDGENDYEPDESIFSTGRNSREGKHKSKFKIQVNFNSNSSKLK